MEEAGSVDRMDMFNNVISNLQDPVERFKEEEATGNILFIYITLFFVIGLLIFLHIFLHQIIV